MSVCLSGVARLHLRLYDLSYEDGALLVMDVLPDYTAPEVREGLAYEGTEQGLVVPGEVRGEPARYAIVYALSEDGGYSEDVPTARDAGTYDVWWKIVYADDHSRQAGSIPTQRLSVTVDQREAELAWSGTEWWYDGFEHVPTATVANLVAGDACEVTVTGAQTEIGTHTATATKLTDDNYRLPASATTSFVIKLAEVVIPSEIVIKPGAPEVSSSNLEDVAQLLVSDEERGLAADGVDVHIWVQVNRISESDLSPQERVALDGRLKILGATAGWYLDIRVYKRVGGKVTQIERTPEPLQLAVTVPQELRSLDRTHYLIRGHGYEATVLATTQGEVLEGESDLFLRYLLAYRDEPTPTPPTPTPPTPTPPTPTPPTPTPTPRPSGSPTVLPQTGDPSIAIVDLFVVGLATLALGFALRRANSQ